MTRQMTRSLVVAASMLGLTCALFSISQADPAEPIRFQAAATAIDKQQMVGLAFQLRAAVKQAAANRPVVTLCNTSTEEEPPATGNEGMAVEQDPDAVEDAPCTTCTSSGKRKRKRWTRRHRHRKSVGAKVEVKSEAKGVDISRRLMEDAAHLSDTKGMKPAEAACTACSPKGQAGERLHAEPRRIGKGGAGSATARGGKGGQGGAPCTTPGGGPGKGGAAGAGGSGGAKLGAGSGGSGGAAKGKAVGAGGAGGAVRGGAGGMGSATQRGGGGR